jgi:hypothetical protein
MPSIKKVNEINRIKEMLKDNGLCGGMDDDTAREYVNALSEVIATSIAEETEQESASSIDTADDISDPHRLFTIADASRLTGTPRRTISRWVFEQKIMGEKRNGKWFVSVEQVRRFMRDGKAKFSQTDSEGIGSGITKSIRTKCKPRNEPRYESTRKDYYVAISGVIYQFSIDSLRKIVAN